MTQVANTILAQLGGGKFLAMTGARNLMAGERDLSFRIGRNPRNVTHVRIMLNQWDEYEVEFIDTRRMRYLVRGAFSHVEAAQLRPIFMRETGLEVSL